MLHCPAGNAECGFWLVGDYEDLLPVLAQPVYGSQPGWCAASYLGVGLEEEGADADREQADEE